MCSDLHRLFDLGYLTVTPDLRLEVSERLRGDFRTAVRITRSMAVRSPSRRPRASDLRRICFVGTTNGFFAAEKILIQRRTIPNLLKIAEQPCVPIPSRTFNNLQ